MSARSLSSLPLPHSTLSALTRAGYETVDDLSSTSPENLAKELRIPISASLVLFSASQRPRTHLPASQSAAALSSNATASVFSTACPGADKLLLGGLKRGKILEVSGPPGAPKEAIAVNVVRSFVAAGEAVLFVDAQNMTNPAALCEAIYERDHGAERLVYHLNIHSLPDLMLFMHNLQSHLDAHPKISLLVLNSVSFPFQSAMTLNLSTKNTLLETMKQILTKECASRNLTVVITSQLATRLIDADGSIGNFDTGSKAVILPPLGPTYLPSGSTYRLLMIPESRAAGVVRVFSSPTYQQGKGPAPQESYHMDEGRFQ